MRLFLFARSYQISNTRNLIGPFFLRGESLMQTTTAKLLTVTEIARRLNVPPHTVTYVIKTRGIRTNRWAGHARLFDETAVDRIVAELERIKERAAC